MLKYIKNHMATISGIEIYPILSFLVFFLFFIVATWLILRADKEYVKKMANLPLDQDNLDDQL
jgi:cytochrome c oxidase cbb3-type subunit IV